MCWGCCPVEGCRQPATRNICHPVVPCLARRTPSRAAGRLPPRRLHQRACCQAQRQIPPTAGQCTNSNRAESQGPEPSHSLLARCSMAPSSQHMFFSDMLQSPFATHKHGRDVQCSRARHVHQGHVHVHQYAMDGMPSGDGQRQQPGVCPVSCLTHFVSGKLRHNAMLLFQPCCSLVSGQV